MANASNETISSEAVHERYERVAYWEIVWQQFRKNRLAIFGMACIFMLILLAIFAPLIALNKPFYLTVDGKTSYPFFAALFDRLFFENGVDVFFNLAMVTFPLHLIAFFIVRAVKGKEFRYFWPKLVLILFVVHMVAYVGVMFSPSTHPYRDYKSLIARSEKAGKSVDYLFPPVRHSYREYDLSERNPRPPSWLGKLSLGNAISPAFWWSHRNNLIGTDKEGRDVFTRMLYGTRISLTIGVIAVSIYISIGIVLGSLAGFFGGKVDMIISRFTEIMICFPVFFLILTMAAFIEKRSIFHIMVLIGITRWTGPARLVRGEFLKLKNLDYVQAAKALGMSRTRIIFGHVLPNAISPVLVAATFGIASAILTESSLSFLGLGDPSAPSWGELLSVGRQDKKLWLILTPGLAIFFVVSVFNLVGEGLRDALDPKLRQ